MRFEVEQRFAAPMERVEAAFVDETLLVRLAHLPDLGQRELVHRSVDGDLVRYDVRYHYNGPLPPGAAAVVRPERLSWVQESVLDRCTHLTRFVIVPDHYRDRLECEGAIELAEHGGGTRRLMRGDLRVRARFVAARVEQAIIGGLRRSAAAEARLVQQWLDERRA